MKIGELAQILNMSRDTIRFYEKNGMLTYEVNQENGYHEYSIWDVINLSECLACRKLGISIKSTKELKLNGTIDDIILKYEEICQEIEKEVQDKLLVKDYLQGCLNEMKAASYNLGRYWFEACPEQLCLPYMYRDHTEYSLLDDLDYEAYHAWQESLPVMRGCMFVSLEDLVHRGDAAKETWYLLTESKYAYAQKLPLGGRALKLPSHIGLCTIVDMGERGRMCTSVFKPMLDHLENTPYEPDLEYAYGYFLSRSWKDGKLQRYMKLVIPCKPKKQ